MRLSCFSLAISSSFPRRNLPVRSPGSKYAAGPRTWRLADLGAKHAFLRAGLGWGGMPFELVRSDIARDLLVQIAAEDTPSGGFALAMSAVYRSHAPPGGAGRWFIDCLNDLRSSPRCVAR